MAADASVCTNTHTDTSEFRKLWTFESVFSETFPYCTSQHLFDFLAGLGSGELVNNIQCCLTECVPHPSTDTTLKR